MESRKQNTPLGCVDCDFKCGSVNEMCRHIFTTRHGARKCPKCDTYIVPRAFQAGLQKLIDRRRERSAAELFSTVESMSPLSTEEPSPMALPDISAFSTAEPLTSIAVSGHPHLTDVPNFHSFEKADFILQGDPRDYGLHIDVASDVQSRNASASLTLASANDVSTPAVITVPFRCMDCLNYCPTWTQVTKHIEQSGHTLPVCVQCNQRLKCFGPLRPSQHELKDDHRGFYGVFYTRRDYQCDIQAAQTVYNGANLFTGLSTLQYKCVCGVSFLHPLYLAEHLLRVHHVTCISDCAVCRCCNKSGTFAELIAHLREPCWCSKDGKDGAKSNPAVVPLSMPANPIAAAAVEMARHGRPLEEKGAHTPVYGLDDMAAMAHLVEARNFSGTAFLQFRPLLPPMSDDEVPLISEAHALANLPLDSRSASASASTSASAARKPSYSVLYQCRECLFLFSSWDRIVQHIHATGHCRTYCTECGTFLPELLNYSASERSSASRAQQQHQRLYNPQLPPEGHMFASASTPAAVRCTSLAAHIDHLHRHGDIIGFPASPETLEVLVDVNAACYGGSLDPQPEKFTNAPRTLMVYQCPAQHKGCYEVFLHYGDFIAHLLTSGHGIKHESANPTNESKQSALVTLPTSYPMVTYHAKFTVAQLHEHFGFVQCPYCETAFPQEEEQLHIALCVERRRRFGRAS
ncbi:hypothetical protein ABB37_01800 [Leptomonas pyrrhocoris]|uniref:C2H2-type domain-containing protein n=1 Tax=Leptomonas pyrrhocoris TaxID=157538 RepID=A0A0M9G9Q4_LEPPY|nr:hypothetical protein ABB37_01800 [Leptomonas pyrrhocoris]KPA85526.1 hypothetical protein ABB37_01800 [Leptomonas pyrrhocoris]|eukprot:XP_015663965.1 hypothetical protein ABB37_01800 [Leptomonas pyrrhocoris]